MAVAGQACAGSSSDAVQVPDPRGWCKNAPPMPAKEGNLHPVDVALWFYNIRANVEQRIVAFR